MRRIILSSVVAIILVFVLVKTANSMEEKPKENFYNNFQIDMSNNFINLNEVFMNKNYDKKEEVKGFEVEYNDTVPDTKYEIYNVSAYTAGLESTGKTPNDPEYGITASGEKVKKNYTLACPPSLEFGTKIYIPYFDNIFTCTDRGSAITEGKLDVYMESLDDALEFGRKDLEIVILGGE